MRTYEIYWGDLNEEARERLAVLYHENIVDTPIAYIDIEENDNEEEI